MSIHFEELWQMCENLHQKDGNSSALVDELIMKLNLYKTINQKSEIPKFESQKLKLRVLGEVLLTITNLSLNDDIDVFEALNTAREYKCLTQSQIKT